MTEIAVESISATGGRVRSSVRVRGDHRRFFSESELTTEYDTDVSELPDGVLSIPVLGTVCPVAWALGADVRAPAVDRRFLESLRSVGSTLHEMYPSFVEGGTVIAAEATEPTATAEDQTGRGVLFDGGVDSLATYARRRSEDPTLVAVGGWDFDADDEGWQRTRTRLESYGRRFDAPTALVRSNVRSFLDREALRSRFGHLHEGDWDQAVGGGIGRLAMCAPLSVVEGIGTMYAAANRWRDCPVPDVTNGWDGDGMPWATHPEIVDNVRWGAASGAVDGFDLTRQDRLEIVADFVEDRHPDLPIRACSDGRDGGNCSECEACCRTAFGLAVRGLDPNRHGFDFDAEAFERSRERLASGDWLTEERLAADWMDIRAHMDPEGEFPIAGAASVAEWAVETDVESLARPSRPERFVRAVARRTPAPVASKLPPVYDEVKRRVPRP